VRAGLEAEGLTAALAREDNGLALSASVGEGGKVFHYRLTARSRPRPALTALDAPEGRRAIEWRLMAYSADVVRPRDVTGFTQDQLVSDVLDHLQRWRMA
jgi:choline/glycine/proline betaine transport protein